MLFYTFNLVISAEKTNEHRRRKKTYFLSEATKSKSRDIFLLLRIIFSTTRQPRERRCCYEKSQFTTETERLKNKVRRMNEWTYIEVSTSRYNIIMSIRVFYWLIKVDVINCCLIHNTNAANISTLWENDITRNEHNQTRHDCWMIDQQWFRFVRDSSVIIGRWKFSRNYFPASNCDRGRDILIAPTWRSKIGN